MKTITDHNALGFSNLVVNGVPESAEEFDTIAGKSGACVEEAISNVLYRGWNAEFRKGVQKAIKDTTGFERLVVKQGPPKKDGTTSPIYESEADYVKRYLAQEVGLGKTKDAVMADLNGIAIGVAKSLKFDPKPSTRSTGPGKEWEAAAQSTLSSINNDPARVAKLVAKLEGLNEGMEITVGEDGLVSVEELAKALKTNAARETAALAS